MDATECYGLGRRVLMLEGLNIESRKWRFRCQSGSPK